MRLRSVVVILTCVMLSAVAVPTAGSSGTGAGASDPEDMGITSIAFSPAHDGTVYLAGRPFCGTWPVCAVALFKSSDGGASWVQLEAKNFDGRDIILPPAHGSGDDRIFGMSMLVGLQVSSDGGKTFRSAAPGAPLAVGTADISPDFNSGDPRIIVGGTARGLWQYVDDLALVAPARYAGVRGLLAEPAYASPNLLVVGGHSYDEGGSRHGTVFRCTKRLPRGVCKGTQIYSGPATPQVRLSADFAQSGVVYAFNPGQLHVSSDEGRSFTARPVPQTNGSLIDLWDAGDVLFGAVWKIGQDGDQGLYRSEDGGLSWDQVAHSLLDPGVRRVRSSGDIVIVALDDGGIACSDDLGETWDARC